MVITEYYTRPASKWAGLLVGGIMNMERSNKIMKTQEDKASLYMSMGLMLIIVTTLWILSSAVPKVVFLAVAVIGIIPTIRMVRTEFCEASDCADTLWNKAMHSTLKWVLGLLTYLFVSACINKIMDLGLCTDVCYIIPMLIGMIYILKGHYFLTYKRMEETEE